MLIFTISVFPFYIVFQQRCFIKVEIFEISSPSLSFGGFYEWGDMPEEIFFNERDKFGDDFWATEINLATKLDLYTYPEINGKVNTLKWDGQNYVYNMIERKYDRSPESGPVEWT